MTRVLVVEDSRTQAEVLRAHLDDAGYRVEVAHDGVQALSLLEQVEVDLVVSDVVMPRMDGYELCRRVKASPATAAVPVVLLTTLTDPLDVVSGLEAGADNFIRKPYQAEVLLARLKTTLEERHTHKPSSTTVRVSFLHREFDLTTEGGQVLDLLTSTFEELVGVTRRLRAREEELARARAELEQHLRVTVLERNRLQVVVDTVPVPLFVIGPEQTVDLVSRATGDILGIDAELLVGRHADEVGYLLDAQGVPIPPHDLPYQEAVRERRTVTRGDAFDLFFARGEGVRQPVLVQASPTLDEQGGVTGGVVTMQVLGSLTQHDPVTGLPNRMAFLDQLARVATSGADEAAVLLLELDGMGRGGSSLDSRERQVSAATVRLLQQQVEDVVCDEPGGCFMAATAPGQFGIVLAGASDPLTAVRLAEVARSRAAGENGAADLTASMSVGISLAPAREAAILLAGAEAALRRARDNGGDRVEVFGPGASQEAMEHLRLERDLRAAVRDGQIRVQYQPQVDLRTGEVLGFEALARWHHEELGPVSPERFIALAEQGPLILELGRKVLLDACRQALTWPDGPDGHALTVSVNASASQLRPGFVEEVLDVLHETGLEPERLLVELTETAVMQDPELTVALLEELRRHGVRCSLDDFGTGYSSLAQLTRIPLDQLKLDRSFVTALVRGGPDELVARSIVALGHALAVPVLAEGVEEEHQAEALRELGCDEAQGYLYARPMTPDEARRWAKDRAVGVVRR